MYKVLHYITGFSNGGIETLLVNLANKQAEKGIHVSVMILSDNVSDGLLAQLSPNVDVLRINKPKGSKNPWYWFKMNLMYLRYRPDVFHFHINSGPFFFPRMAMSDRRYVTIHNNTTPVTSARSVEKYIAISNCVRNFYIRSTGRDNCVVCNNAVDIDSFTRKTEYAQTPHRMLCVGRLNPVKGIDVLIAAVSLAKVAGYDFSMDIWGDGDQKDALDRQISEYGLRDVVTLVGDVPNTKIKSGMCGYDVVVQPSRNEGFGIAAVEAMVCGVPLILTDVGGFREVSAGGRYALLAESDDPQALSEAMIEMCDRYEKYVAVAKEAVEYACGSFSMNAMERHINSIYEGKE